MSVKNVTEISKFIVGYISAKLGVSEDAISKDEPLTNVGLSSREAVVMTAELEDFLGRPVDPAVAWEHPTINKIAAHLGGQS